MGHEYVTIAKQKRQSVRYCNHKIPWYRKEYANIESGSGTPSYINSETRLGLCHNQSESLGLNRNLQENELI